MNFMHDLIVPLVLMGVMGAVFGALLAIASVVFRVRQDERVGKIRAVLPGANCGGCGYPGCDSYADGVVNEGAGTNLCVVGGSAVSARVAEIMGVKAEETVPMRAFVRCLGSAARSPRKVLYSGIADCRSAVMVPGGSPNECPFGCIGFGTCTKVCNFDAIFMGPDGLPVVDREQCVGCGACVSACPKDVLTLIPQTSDVVVACGSHWKGPAVRRVCSIGCIGCGLCARVCPVGAITMDRDLAVIDPAKCTNCGLCAQKCPAKCIETGQSLAACAKTA